MSHNRFSRVGRLHKGYHRRQVDAFVNHVEVSLSGMFPAPTTAEVREAGFELVRGGYEVTEVDRFLDALEERVLLAQGMTAGRRGKVDPSSDASFLRGELDLPYMKRFPRAGALRRGYHQDDVDDFVDVVVAGLDGRGPLTLDAVRQVRFRPRRGGYREDPVDEAMDRVVEHLLLLRKQAGSEPPSLHRPAD